MKYFNTLPNIFLKDNNGSYVAMKNLLVRADLITDLSKNIELFYEYSIQERDTPESVAYRYYGDQYRYWIIMCCNKLFDAQWNWPLTSQQFSDYIDDKYATEAESVGKTPLQYANSTIHHYEKIVITLDEESGYQTTKNIIVDEQTYNNIVTFSKTSTIGATRVTYTLDKKAVSIYDYENDTNESKRNIKLINAVYANDLEQQLKDLMNA